MASNDPADDVPADQECVDVMNAIENWLAYWSNVLSQRDGPKYVPEFAASMGELADQIMGILARHNDEEDNEHEYVPARDGATH